MTTPSELSTCGSMAIVVMIGISMVTAFVTGRSDFYGKLRVPLLVGGTQAVSISVLAVNGILYAKRDNRFLAIANLFCLFASAATLAFFARFGGLVGLCVGLALCVVLTLAWKGHRVGAFAFRKNPLRNLSSVWAARSNSPGGVEPNER